MGNCDAGLHLGKHRVILANVQEAYVEAHMVIAGLWFHVWVRVPSPPPSRNSGELFITSSL